MRCSLESGWVLARRRDTKQAVPSSFLGKGRVLSPCATSLRMSTPSAVQARASKALALAQAAGGGPSPDGRWPEIVSGGVCCVHTHARAASRDATLSLELSVRHPHSCEYGKVQGPIRSGRHSVNAHVWGLGLGAHLFSPTRRCRTLYCTTRAPLTTTTQPHTTNHHVGQAWNISVSRTG